MVSFAKKKEEVKKREVGSHCRAERLE